MDTRLLKSVITATLAALVFTVGGARADDTDVYMNPGAGLPPGSEPMVMFSLDYRPNLAARGGHYGVTGSSDLVDGRIRGG